MSTQPITVPCPTCSATGTDTHEDRHTETRMDTCRTCGGERFIPARTGETPEASFRPEGSTSPTPEGGAPGEGLAEQAKHHGRDWAVWWQGSGDRGDHIMEKTQSGLAYARELAFLGPDHPDAARQLVAEHNEQVRRLREVIGRQAAAKTQLQAELGRIRAVIPASLLYDTNDDMVEAVTSTFRSYVKVAAEATALRKQVSALASPASAPPPGIGGGDALREALIGWYGETEDMNRLLDGDLPDSAPVYVVGARRSRYQMGTYGDLRRAALAQPQPVTEPSSGGGTTYQYREIGEGDGWRDCSKATYDSFQSDPHIDTREVAAPTQPPRDDGAREALAEATETLKAITRAVGRCCCGAVDRLRDDAIEAVIRRSDAALSAPESVGPGEWPAGYQETFDAIGKAVTVHPHAGLNISVRGFYQALGYSPSPAPALPATGEETGERCGYRFVSDQGGDHTVKCRTCGQTYEFAKDEPPPCGLASPPPAETPAPVEGGR